MKLNEEQKNLLIEKLTPLLKSSVCFVCKEKQWFISEEIFEIREFEYERMTIGKNNALLPIISVTCENCGNTIFFNALTLGVIKLNNEQTREK